MAWIATPLNVDPLATHDLPPSGLTLLAAVAASVAPLDYYVFTVASRPSYAIEEVAGACTIFFKLPLVLTAKQCNLNIGDDVVEIDVPNIYEPRSISLPRVVDYPNATARFDTNLRMLKVFLPFVPA